MGIISAIILNNLSQLCNCNKWKIICKAAFINHFYLIKQTSQHFTSKYKIIKFIQPNHYIQPGAGLT